MDNPELNNIDNNKNGMPSDSGDFGRRPDTDNTEKGTANENKKQRKLAAAKLSLKLLGMKRTAKLMKFFIKHRNHRNHRNHR